MCVHIHACMCACESVTCTVTCLFVLCLCAVSSVDWVRSTISSTDTLVIMNKTDLWKEIQSLPSVSTIGVRAYSLFRYSLEGLCMSAHVLHHTGSSRMLAVL